MNRSEFQISGNFELTTREVVMSEVAATWLAAHPDVEVTVGDVAKTLQQFITEMFLTGGRRQRQALSAHAVSVLGEIGVGPEQFAPVRTFAKAADMPMEYGVMVGALATALAPLAVAAQLARIPVTNRAVRLVEPGEGIDRRRLRGFVVGHVRPHAQEVYALVGTGATADAYLREILADVDRLAAAVVTSARATHAKPTVLDDDAAERTAEFGRLHLGALMGYAAARFGQQADDIVGAAMVKMAMQFRNDPDLRAGFAYGRTVVDHVAIDVFNASRVRNGREVCDSDVVERVAETVLGLDGIGDDVADVMIGMVLAAAERLAADGDDPDAVTARAALLEYFLVDARETHPRRAHLAERALQLMATNEQVGIGAELGQVAAGLGADGAGCERVAALALSALRAGLRSR